MRSLHKLVYNADEVYLVNIHSFLSGDKKYIYHNNYEKMIKVIFSLGEIESGVVDPYVNIIRNNYSLNRNRVEVQNILTANLSKYKRTIRVINLL